MDGQFQWTPCGNDLAKCLGLIIEGTTVEQLMFEHTEIQGVWTISQNALLTDISFNNLTALTGIRADVNITDNATLATVSFPLLTGASYALGAPGSFLINLCPSLTDISLPVFNFTNDFDWFFNDNSLTQACVDAILERAALSIPFNSSSLFLNGGSNATPSAAGLINKGIINGRGAFCATN